MSTGVAAYPLSWPANRPRTPSHRRERSAFKVASIGVARDEVLREVKLLGGRHAVISSNLRTRNDGLPYADQRQPEDPAVAVYYLDRKGRQKCFACDRWAKVEDNLRAIAKAIDALRGIERWGTGDMVETAFAGFAALGPAPGDVPPRNWWDVIGVPPHASADLVHQMYHQLAWDRHPDAGGTNEAMAELNRAYGEFKKERGA